MNKIKISDVSDGICVAKFFVGRYLNSYSYSKKKFLDAIGNQPVEVQENFTYLAFKWFQELSEVTSYDLRNEASVLMSQTVCSHMEKMPKMHHLVWNGTAEMDVEERNDVEAANLLGRYLVAGSKDQYKGFLTEALRQHRTLQQSLTRLFKEWFNENRGNTPEIKEANVYMQQYLLPMI